MKDFQSHLITNFFGENVDYVGNCRKGRIPHGYGRMTFENGDCYSGNFINGLPERGTYHFSSGTYISVKYNYNFFKSSYTKTYYGKFSIRNYKKESKIQGEDGYYLGETKYEKAHGIGAYHFNDGKVVEGGFVNGVAHGVVKIKYPNGENEYCIYQKGECVSTIEDAEDLSAEKRNMQKYLEENDSIEKNIY